MEREALARIIRSCGESRNLIQGRLIHARILEQQPDLLDRYLENLLVQMYGKCGSLDEARAVFDRVHAPNAFSWSIIMTAYAQSGDVGETREIFDRMPDRGVVAWTTLLSAYAQNRHLEETSSIFAKMPEHSLVAWNGMISAFGQNNQPGRAKDCFDRMPGRNTSSWNAIVSVFALHGQISSAQEAFERMPERNSMAWNPIIHALNLRGDVSSAMRVFESLPDRCQVSSSTMISGYSQAGRLDQAKALFDSLPQPDEYACSSMLQAFAKAGDLHGARETFDRMPQRCRDTPSWNAMMGAYAQNGHGGQALELFATMLHDGIAPNEMTFSTVLHSCSHLGRWREAIGYFRSLRQDHGLVPDGELYSSMVDVLGRNGRLREAEEVMVSMPYAPNQAAFASLLAACRLYHDSKRASLVAGKFARHLEEQPEVESIAAEPYVQLANIYRDGSL